MTEETVNAELKRLPANITVTADKIDEVAAWLAMARAPERYSVNVPFTVTHKDMQPLDLERLMPMPSRVRKQIEFTDVDSFVEYFNDFAKNESARIFSRLAERGLDVLCVLDYDTPGALQDGKTAPSWCDHQTSLSLKYHPDYAALLANADIWHEQQDFALFIEENLHLFVKPTGADMLELSQQLKGKRNVSFQSGKRLSNGETAIEFIETVQAQSTRGEIIVPEYLELVTPMFDGFPARTIKAAFRWNSDRNSNKITFAYRLLTKQEERLAVEEVKSGIAEKTGLPILNVSSFNGVAYRTKEAK